MVITELSATMRNNDNINKKRILKNTIFLYIRMIFVLAANFYAVRLLLQIIGVEDYGVYNIVYGLAILFSSLNSAMTSMVQRYLCYEIGRHNDFCLRQVFSISVFFFVILSLLIIVFSETVGLWFVCRKLSIPEDRVSAAYFVYQFSIIAVVISTLQIPYNSAIIAFEKMGVFSKISIANAILTLASIFLLNYVDYDRLKAYSIFVTATALVIFAWYVLYCVRTFPCCRGGGKLNKIRLLAMMRFFLWSTLGALGNIAKTQGLNILLNIFFGVAFNATWALGQKVMAAVGMLLTNFQTAFNPQLLKSYKSPDKEGFMDLLIVSSKYSYFLLYLAIFPVMLKTDFFLRIWLGNNIPPYLSSFVQLLLIVILFDSFNGPLGIAAQADGRIAVYQICITSIYFLSVGISYVFLVYGSSPIIIPFSVSFTAGIMFLYRLGYLKKLKISCTKYFMGTIPAVFLVTIVSVGGYGLLLQIANSIWTLVFYSIVLNPILIVVFGLNRKEKTVLVNKIKEKIHGHLIEA